MNEDARATGATLERGADQRPDQPREGQQRELFFPQQDAGNLRARWSDIQAAFVDEPREAVRRADAFVSEVMDHLAQVFAHERATLEQQWDRGDQVTTEDLRVSLQRYRAFLDHLLTV